MTDVLQDLRNAERRLQAAQLTSDVAALTDLIHEDAVYVAPDGQLMTRADDLAAHAGGVFRLSRVDEEDLRVVVTHGVGVTFFLGVLEGVVDGNPMQARMRYTRTWARDEHAGWRVVAAHASALPPAPEQ